MMCDSRNHKVFEVFDTERGLPVEPTTEVEWQRSVKQLDKKLNSIKSLFGIIEHDTGKSVSEKDKRQKLIDEFGEKLDWDGIFSGSGDEKTQFCLWIRPHSLLEDAYYQKQIVGHTEYCFNMKQDIINML